MIYFTLLIPAVMLALGIWKWEKWDVGGSLLVTFGAIVLVILLIVYPCITVGNGSALAKHQAFFEANTQNFATAVDNTAAYLSVDSFAEGLLIEGSLEKLQLATIVAERITEWRDAVNAYNLGIASMQYYDQNALLGVLYPDAVQEMKLLIIE